MKALLLLSVQAFTYYAFDRKCRAIRTIFRDSPPNEAALREYFGKFVYTPLGEGAMIHVALQVSRVFFWYARRMQTDIALQRDVKLISHTPVCDNINV